MLHLGVHLRFHFKEHTKRHKNVQKKMHFMLQLTVQSRGSPEGTFDCAPKDELSDLDKDALEVALALHLWFHLLMQ